MELKNLLLFGLIGYSLSSLTNADFRTESAPSGIVGWYQLSGNSGNTMNILKQQNGFRVELEGGGEDSSGPGTTAVCIIHANGILKGNRMTATFAAVDTDTFLYTNEQAKSENRKIEIQFGPGRATVLYADTLGYCGYGADFEGIYRRENRP